MSKLLPILLDQIALSRRGALTIAGIAGTTTVSQAFAKGPLANTQAPNFYRFKLGGAEATIVTDGTLPVGDPTHVLHGVLQRRPNASLIR